jgi:serine protease Do
MIRAIVCIALLFAAGPAQAQGRTGDYLRTNPQFLQLFREVGQKSRPSVARIQCDGFDTSLGVVVGADGWILTKADDLQGKITCRLAGRSYDAKIVGVNEDHDLALLKIDADRLQPITWANSQKTRAGSWVASIGPGEMPLAVGVVSVATRKMHEAFLGLQVEPAQEGMLVLNIFLKSAALKAGVRQKDIIVRVNGQHYTDPEAFAQMLAGHKPGDTLTLTIRRQGKEKDFKAVLQSREKAGDFRADFQNRLGSELSNRRSGYSVILQHDSVLKPGDCGSPLVDLEGRVIGLNISRAGRVESWALPAEIVQPLIAPLKSGRFSPREK